MKSPRTLRHSLLAAAAIAAIAAPVPPAGAATYSWDVGNFSASGVPSTLSAADTLNIGYGNYKYVDSGMSNAGTVNWVDTLYFENGSTFSNSGVWNATADSAFVDNGFGGNFVNSGIFRKSGGVSTTIGSGIGFTNSGTIDAQTGSINFTGTGATFNAGTQFTGAGQVLVSNSAAFNGAFTSQNLQLAAGTYTGNAAQINGTVNWTTGTLAGSWEVAAGQTLNLQAGNYHYLNGSLNNLGSLKAVDNLYFTNGNTLTNQGVYELQADVSLTDGGFGGNFVNQGTLRKSGGSGSSQINGSVNFVNAANGVIDVQSGNISFASGAATFNAGTQFTGAGQALVTSNAVFNGAFGSQNLQLAAGTYTGNAAQINGNVNWVTGIMVGGWELASGQVLNLQAGNYKSLNGSLNNLGTITAQDTLYFQNGNTLTNQALYDIQGDFGLGDGGYSGAFVNNGVFRKSAGTGSSNLSNVVFTNNGEINAQTGTINFAGGTFRFNDGTKFTGAGQVVVNTNATFVGTFTTANNLTLANSGVFTGGDGTAASKAVMNGNTNWSTGTLAGTWDVAAGRTLTLQSGNYKYINGSVTNLGTMAALDTLYLQNGNTLTNQTLYDIQGDFGLGDGGYSGTFTNNGVFRKSAGSSNSYVNGITFINNGEINAQTGTITFAAGTFRFNDGTQFSGNGQVLMNASATFVGSFTTADNLTLANAAAFTGGDGTAGSKAVMNGNTNWSTGTLAGTWDVASTRTLALQVGNYKYINGSVTNLGTMAALDTLYLQNGNTLTNQALYDLQADAGLGDGGYSGTFINNGVLRKSAGTGSSGITGISFTNNGEINAQTGTISFTGGNLRFNDGTKFSGAGQVGVNASATFVGAYTTASNLTLASGGTFVGGDGSLGSKAVMNGNTNWSIGTLTGNWEVAAGRTLTLQPGNYKYINGSFTNHGSVAAQDTVYLQNGNTVTNAALWDLQGDVGVGDGGYSGSFVNTGLVVKSAGSGTSSVAQVAFSNATGGVVDVRTGALQLPANFTNQGTLKGAGAFTTNLLSNDGHVAPGSIGAAPGLLALNGNFAQSALGSFDVGLQDLSNFGNLSVSGTTSLAGTIEVDCVGTCSFAAGTQLVVLHSTGLLSGSFGSLTTSGFAAGAFAVTYVGDDVILQVTQATVAAVPEPASYALLLAGLGAVGFMARRRRAA